MRNKILIMLIFSTLLVVIPGQSQFRSLAEEQSGEISHSETSVEDKEYANVISVQVNGEPNKYMFFVEIKSPDLGCNQYANWWEIITGDGKLIYRRILYHSHVNEQPFTRSGGPVQIHSHPISL